MFCFTKIMHLPEKKTLDESLNTAMESLSIYSLTVHWVPAAKRTKKMYPLQAQLLSF